MTARYDQEITALLMIDPYNDFISEGGKVWDRRKAVAEGNDCVPHMLQVLNAAQGGAAHLLCAASSVPSGRLREQMHAALEINIPNYASAIVRTDEIVRSLSSR